VVLVCISPVAKDVRRSHLFIGNSTSFENCLLSSFAHLLIGLFVLLVFTISSSLNILDINSLSEDYVAKIFSHSAGCLFTLLIVKPFNLM
jgi:hypothetical protein